MILDQIIELQRRGYRRCEMRVRATRVALNKLTIEYRDLSTMALHQGGPLEEIQGVPIEEIPGILDTCYVWVPFGDYQILAPDKLVLIDADRRVLDECLVEIREVLLTFEPFNVIQRDHGRVDIEAWITQ